MTDAAAELATLTANAADVLPAGALGERLAAAHREDRPLRVKFGIDPTTADIHLGHCVVFQKLREFQDAGHVAVLIIGDYTALVGDPSQRSRSRPMADAEAVAQNALTYQEQAMRILDPDPAKLEVRYNGEWLGALTPRELFALLQGATLARILERDDFAKRYAANDSITLLELTYPLLQGYDSVPITADVELGGTDQLYNLLMGREVQTRYGVAPQSILTMPILTGTDGVQKMSKSLGNYIGVTDSADEMFGKTMSIPDEAMPEWFRLATGLTPAAATAAVRRIETGEHPNQMKQELATSVAARFHGMDAALAAKERFRLTFAANVFPEDAPVLAANDLPENDAGRVFLPLLLTKHLAVQSSSEARRLIKQGALKVNGKPIAGDVLEVERQDLVGAQIQVGSRKFLRVTDDLDWNAMQQSDRR